MDKGFYIGMKVTLNSEYGVVIERIGDSDWDKEPGIIRWDSNKQIDEEDWRGLYGSFVNAGGKKIDSTHQFQYINEKGELIRASELNKD
jgi:hypothetical protein